MRADPKDAEAQLELGFALLQRVRETADPRLYRNAELAFQAARDLLPGDARPHVGLGGVHLGRHEFDAALESGQSALDLDPTSLGAGAVVVDALIELGRYDDAFESVDALVSASEDLATLSRLSYARELQGDVPGALSAMEQAASSASPIPENTAFALSIVGHLRRLNGDVAGARAAYAEALRLVPNHAPSLAGRARLAVGAGDLDGAAVDFERAAAILPLPEYVIALGEVYEAGGRGSDATKQYELARAELRLFEASGVIVDVEFSLFEADHGDPARARRFAEAGYTATPTVRAADALGWALYRAGATTAAGQRAAEALRLGSRDPLFLYHAGAIAAVTGNMDVARRDLEAAVASDPGFSATGARDARAILATLD